MIPWYLSGSPLATRHRAVVVSIPERVGKGELFAMWAYLLIRCRSHSLGGAYYGLPQQFQSMGRFCGCWSFPRSADAVWRGLVVSKNIG